jgi:hypothetical protein
MHESRTRIEKDITEEYEQLTTGSYCECGWDPWEWFRIEYTLHSKRKDFEVTVQARFVFSLNKIVECLWKRLPRCSKWNRSSPWRTMFCETTNLDAWRWHLIVVLQRILCFRRQAGNHFHIIESTTQIHYGTPWTPHTSWYSKIKTIQL